MSEEKGCSAIYNISKFAVITLSVPLLLLVVVVLPHRRPPKTCPIVGINRPFTGLMLGNVVARVLHAKSVAQRQRQLQISAIGLVAKRVDDNVQNSVTQLQKGLRCCCTSAATY